MPRYVTEEQLAARRDERLAVLRTDWPDLFRPEDDATWDAWINETGPGYKLLRRVVKGDYGNGMKARAIALLLAPAIDWSPVYYNHGQLRTQETFLSVSHDWLRHLPAHLLPFYAYQVLANCEALDLYEPVEYSDPNHLHNPKACHAQLHDHLRAIMGYMPVEQQAAAFARYSLQLPSSLGSTNSYLLLMRDDAIPDMWKERADIAMRRVVEGATEPAMRTELYENYVNVFQVLAADAVSYGPDALADQIVFLSRHYGHELAEVLGPDTMRQTIQRLVGPDYVETRHNLVYACFCGSIPLDIDSHRLLRFAQEMLVDQEHSFAEHMVQPTLIAAITKAITDGTTYLAARDTARDEEHLSDRRARRALRAAMR